jgi:hypothetical protein
MHEILTAHCRVAAVGRCSFATFGTKRFSVIWMNSVAAAEPVTGTDVFASIVLCWEIGNVSQRDTHARPPGPDSTSRNATGRPNGTRLRRALASEYSLAGFRKTLDQVGSERRSILPLER